eukprot:scaffold87966_cov75-Phaeocystis_antarctica.AAC.2
MLSRGQSVCREGLGEVDLTGCDSADEPGEYPGEQSYKVCCVGAAQVLARSDNSDSDRRREVRQRCCCARSVWPSPLSVG